MTSHFILRLNTVVLGFCFALGCFAVDVDGFKVAGQLSNWRSVATNFVAESAWTFEASSMGRNWLVVSHSTNGQHISIGSDGESVYKLFEDEAATKSLKVRSHPGNVFRGSYPVQSGDLRTALPWLAYCSGNHLMMLATNGVLELPAPWLNAWADPMAHIYEAKYEEIASSGGLPRRLEYKLDADKVDSLIAGNTLAVIPKSERDRMVMALSTYYKKITEAEAIYQVANVTNYGRLVLPVVFTFERFIFKTKGERLIKTVLARTQGEVTTVELIHSLDPYPKACGEVKTISVADYRAGDPKNGVPFIGYSAPNSLWLRESDPQFQRLRVTKLESFRWHLDTPKVARILVLLVLASLVALPLLFNGVRLKVRTCA